jgi:hypothetical protein
MVDLEYFVEIENSVVNSGATPSLVCSYVIMRNIMEYYISLGPGTGI